MHQNSGDIDVTRLIDDCGVNRFNLRLTLIAFLVVVVEGYDIAVLAFALPDLMASWHIANAASLGPLLTASVVGMLIGAPLFGYLGDRFGRRWTTILSCLVFSFFTALVLAASSLEQIFALRLLAGLGLGGAAPNVIALVSEYAPARRRAMMATIMFPDYASASANFRHDINLVASTCCAFQSRPLTPAAPPLGTAYLSEVGSKSARADLNCQLTSTYGGGFG